LLRAWSYSRWDVYDACPRQARYKFIDKLPEAEGPALRRGKDLHEQAEQFLKGELETLPVEFGLFRAELTAFQVRCGASLEAEGEWAFNERRLVRAGGPVPG
jgi:hypothetical protein